MGYLSILNQHEVGGNGIMESNIAVILFNEAGKAEMAYEGLEAMEEDGKLVIDDAVIASRGPEGVPTVLPTEQTGTFTEATPQPGTNELGATHVKVTQTHSQTRKRVTAGGGVGLLAGVLLGGPIVGLVAGVSLGALSENMREKGLDDKAVHDVADHLKPDTSALFLMAHDVQQEAILERVSLFKAELVTTTLPEEKAEALRKALEEEA
jgi:uncharacterized membrane protein